MLHLYSDIVYHIEIFGMNTESNIYKCVQIVQPYFRVIFPHLFYVNKSSFSSLLAPTCQNDPGPPLSQFYGCSLPNSSVAP